MRKVFAIFSGLVLALCCFCGADAQNPSGALNFKARITPTAARPEPVRQFTFYVLTKSYGEVVKEIQQQNALPTREKFIDELKVSPELKEWMKAHEVLDLAAPGFDRLLTADEIIRVPEFLLAYQRSNSGGVTQGIPKPKYRESEQSENPERYKKQVQEYHAALKKFIRDHPETVTGIELEFEGINPQHKWQQLQAQYKNRVLRLAPSIAQTKYLAAKADTDLDGSASLSGLPAGQYWISTLNLDATAGDVRLAWDVPVTIAPGQTVQIELTNLNAVDTHASTP
jgi:hypothetical protein